MSEEKKIVKVLSVEPNATIAKRAGGTYQALKFNFEDNGKATFRGIMHFKEELVAKIQEFEPNDIVELTFTTVNGMSNLTNAVKTDKSLPKPTTAASGGFKRGGFGGQTAEDRKANADGQAVGNAITNATNLVIAQITTKSKVDGGNLIHEIETIARELVNISGKLKAELSGAPVVSKPVEIKKEVKAEVKKVVKPVEVVEEEEDDLFA